MKIALLGSAPSVALAPFKNAAHAEWVQGKIDSLARAHAQITGEFHIWGCSPGCWAVIPRATTWFELHRWEPSQPWFSPEYMQFLRDFKGTVWTGGAIPEIPNHQVYPIDAIEEQFASYNLTSSVALMQALAIRTIEQIRRARRSHQDAKWEAERRRVAATDPVRVSAQEAREVSRVHHALPEGIDPAELDKTDEDDVIGLWGIDMAAGEEYAYQRPGCQNMILEAMRRYIACYLPPESDLMRPMPVYGISEWDHSYIKLTSRSRELNRKIQNHQTELNAHQEQLRGATGEMLALQHFVATWTSPYGMKHGLLLRQDPGTGLGSGITHYDGRPITRMTVGAPEPSRADVMKAMAEKGEFEEAKRAQALHDELLRILKPHFWERGVIEGAADTLRRIIAERESAYDTAAAAKVLLHGRLTHRASSPKATRRRK